MGAYIPVSLEKEGAEATLGAANPPPEARVRHVFWAEAHAGGGQDAGKAGQHPVFLYFPMVFPPCMTIMTDFAISLKT